MLAEFNFSEFFGNSPAILAVTLIFGGWIITSIVGSITGNVLDNATLSFVHSDDITFGGPSQNRTISLMGQQNGCGMAGVPASPTNG